LNGKNMQELYLFQEKRRVRLGRNRHAALVTDGTSASDLEHITTKGRCLFPPVENLWEAKKWDDDEAYNFYIETLLGETCLFDVVGRIAAGSSFKAVKKDRAAPNDKSHLRLKTPCFNFPTIKRKVRPAASSALPITTPGRFDASPI
jgi:hypothetical protein